MPRNKARGYSYMGSDGNRWTRSPDYCMQCGRRRRVKKKRYCKCGSSMFYGRWDSTAPGTKAFTS